MKSEVFKAQTDATAKVNDLFRMKGEATAIIDGLLNDLHTIRLGLENEKENKQTLDGYTIEEWKSIAGQNFADYQTYKVKYGELIARVDDVAAAADDVKAACNEAKGY